MLGNEVRKQDDSLVGNAMRETVDRWCFSLGIRMDLTGQVASGKVKASPEAPIVCKTGNKAAILWTTSRRWCGPFSHLASQLNGEHTNGKPSF